MMGNQNSSFTHSHSDEETDEEEDSSDSALSDIRIVEQSASCNVKYNQHQHRISGWPAKCAVSMVSLHIQPKIINVSPDCCDAV